MSTVTSNPIDVIVPVHNQRELVINCLGFVLQARNNSVGEVIVIDDASTDAELRKWLQRQSSAGTVTLLTNEENLGFTKTANRGMRLHPVRDVVLLNSDTAVYGNWLDRLRDVAYSDRKVGTVNPLTNASHIGCYPFRTPNGSVAFEISDEDLDMLAAKVNCGRAVRVQTTVGFCQYIRRDLINSIGCFDSERFPFGYGEEVDFCYRATKLGWQHWIAGDIFVRHWEGQSFGARKATLMADMLSVFTRLHPQLPHDDQEFARRDPIRPLRQALDLARLKRLLASGTSLCCRETRPEFELEDPVLLFDSRSGFAEIAGPSMLVLPNLPRYILPREIAAFNTTLSFLGITELAFRDHASAERFRARVRGLPVELGLLADLTVRRSGDSDAPDLYCL
jgi:GT2 family glycosyltransferase